VPSPRPDRSAAPIDPARIEALLGLKRWDEAISLSAELVGQQPNDAVALVLHARGLLGADRAVEAVTSARAARAASPDWDEPWRVEAWALAASNRKQAVVAARRARDRNPDRAANWAALAYLAAQTRGLAEADVAADHVRRLAPDWTESFNVSGVVALKRKQNQEAERWFREGLAIDPSDSHLLNNLALALRGQGRDDEAIALLERSLASDPRSGLTRRNLGVTLQKRVLPSGPVLLSLLGLAVVGGYGVIFAVTPAMVLLVVGLLAVFIWSRVRSRMMSEAHRAVVRDLARESPLYHENKPPDWRRVVILVVLIAAVAALGFATVV
jgi:tetratricopeptide (TPR) repeat protein